MKPKPLRSLVGVAVAGRASVVRPETSWRLATGADPGSAGTAGAYSLKTSRSASGDSLGYFQRSWVALINLKCRLQPQSMRPPQSLTLLLATPEPQLVEMLIRRSASNTPRRRLPMQALRTGLLGGWSSS